MLWYYDTPTPEKNQSLLCVCYITETFAPVLLRAKNKRDKKGHIIYNKRNAPSVRTLGALIVERKLTYDKVD